MAAPSQRPKPKSKRPRRLPSAAGSASRCCATTPAKWYKAKEPCQLPAWKDGYCRKHHPVVTARSVEKRIASNETALAKAKKRVAHYEAEAIRLAAEKAKWAAFISENAKSEGSPPSRLENKQERNGDSLH